MSFAGFARSALSPPKGPKLHSPTDGPIGVGALSLGRSRETMDQVEKGGGETWVKDLLLSVLATSSKARSP